MTRLPLLSTLLFASLATSSYAVITISGNNSASTRLVLASNDGTPLADGSLIRVGFFNDPVGNAVVLSGTDFNAIDTLFRPIGEGAVGGGTVGAGALSTITAGDPAVTGRFSFSVNGITQAYAPQNTPIYFWVFNTPAASQNSEWAIFTNNDSSNGGSPWVVPFDDPQLGGSITLAVTTTRVDDADDVISGSLSTTLGGAPAIRTIPEPGIAALGLCALSLLYRRRRN
jgi:hypothetical protein